MKSESERHAQIILNIEESIAVKQKLLNMTSGIDDCARVMGDTLFAGKKILFCGNGGSAADCQHLATEFVIRLRASFPRPALAAIALTVDTSALTAAGNDFGFDYIFSRQVEALGNEGDLLIGISTSGNSANIIEAVKAARAKGLSVAGLLGNSGGALAEMVDYPLVVPSENTARIQECHLLIGHILCEIVEERLFPK